MTTLRGILTYLCLLRASSSSNACPGRQTDRQAGGRILPLPKPAGSLQQTLPAAWPQTQLLPNVLPKRADVNVAQCDEDLNVCLLTDKMLGLVYGMRTGLCNSCGFQPYLSREGAACPGRVFPLIGNFTCQWQADVWGAKAWLFHNRRF